MTPLSASDANPAAASDAVAALAAARMPLLLACGPVSPHQRLLADGLLALGALLLTDHPTGFFQGNILDLGSPEPGAPLPEQAWKHAEEACKKTDLALVFEPIGPELTALADLVAWSGTPVFSVPAEGSPRDSGGGNPVLDLHAALAWLQAVRAHKDSTP